MAPNPKTLKGYSHDRRWRLIRSTIRLSSVSSASSCVLSGSAKRCRLSSVMWLTITPRLYFYIISQFILGIYKVYIRKYIIPIIWLLSLMFILCVWFCVYFRLVYIYLSHIIVYVLYILLIYDIWYMIYIYIYILVTPFSLFQGVLHLGSKQSWIHTIQHRRSLQYSQRAGHGQIGHTR